MEKNFREIFLENLELKRENRELRKELEKYKKMGLWEFANSLSEDEQVEAGRQLAKSLLGR